MSFFLGTIFGVALANNNPDRFVPVAYVLLAITILATIVMVGFAWRLRRDRLRKQELRNGKEAFI
jgi:hypothetical protein